MNQTYNDHMGKLINEYLMELINLIIIIIKI